VTRSDQRK